MDVLPHIDESWSIERIVKEKTPSTWEDVFEYAMPELEQISKIVEKQRKMFRLCPLQRDVFRAFNITPFHKIKVVILGQDPYHTVLPNGIPIATGLSFSVRKCDAVPPSLHNIYKEVGDNYPDFTIPRHGCLEAWAKQGVFFLNTALTVVEGKPDSHTNIWYGFTRKVVRKIVEADESVIFVLWGRKAEKLEGHIGAAVTILKASHPSGKSAERGFFGCKHFLQINQRLEKLGKEPINWNVL